MPDPSTLRLDAFLPYRLSVVSNLVSDAIAGSYRALFGLRIAEWRLVAVLAEREGLTQQALCARTRMDKVAVSRAAIALSARGLIERAANPDDQRSMRLSLTADGRRLYAEIAPKALEMEARIFADFTDQSCRDLAAMLDRVEEGARRLAGSEGGGGDD